MSISQVDTGNALMYNSWKGNTKHSRGSFSLPWVVLGILCIILKVMITEGVTAKEVRYHL